VNSIKHRKKVQEAHMNHSFYSADRSTHLKIVVLAVCAAIAVLGVGVASRDAGYTQAARVVKAGKPVMVTDSAAAVVR
jgi:hypothetical protein